MEVSAQPMLVLVRGLARLAGDEFLELEQLHAGPVARLWPVDELLGAAAPAASALSRVLGRCVVLCGHSLGCAVAQCLAQQLRVCGLDARGLVALDARTPAPRPLLLREAALHVAAPLAPALRSREAGVARGSRGSREAWARGARGLGLAAELGAQSWRHLLDAEHHDLPASHGWDLAELLERCLAEVKRKGPSGEGGGSEPATRTRAQALFTGTTTAWPPSAEFDLCLFRAAFLNGGWL